MSFADIIAKKMQKNLTKNLKTKTLNPENMKDFLDELKIILLEADINQKVVNALISNIKEQAMGEFIEEGLDSKQMLIKIVHKEFVKILGEHHSELTINTKPTIIMLAGLQGSGKTTTAAKIAAFIANNYKKKCLLVAADTQRLAAKEQLKSLAEQITVPVFTENNASAETIVVNAKKYAIANDFDVVIVDTAGRMHIDETLMKELRCIEQKINPTETLLVVDGMAGQEMINIAQNFIDNIQVKGFIISKLDGSARGGIVLSLGYMTKLPIKFLGMGEKISELETFYPKRMVDRILGMGDIETLIEKAKAKISERDIKTTMERMMLGQFDLSDFLNQLQQVQKVGKLGNLAKMVPGINTKIADNRIKEAETDFKIFEVIINSTTRAEKTKPQLLRYPSRRSRVLKGSGCDIKDLNKLLSQFEKTKKTMDVVAKQVKKGDIPDFSGLKNLLPKNS